MTSYARGYVKAKEDIIEMGYDYVCTRYEHAIRCSGMDLEFLKGYKDGAGI